MNIIANVHTYLIISFLVTIWLIAKFIYHKLDDKLSKDVEDIKDLLENLEQTKLDSEKQIKNLKAELSVANEQVAKSIAEAERQANDMTEKSNREISDLIAKKQIEYEQAVLKMKSSINVEMQNKLVDAVIKEFIKKLKESREDRDFQNAAIDRSLDMLEKLTKT